MAVSISVLALHAHPDDVEFQCAGTLALLRELGCDVTIATMTPGDCGSAEHDAEAISAIRREEARASAALIGATYVCLEFRDLAIFNDDDSRRRVTESIRRARPEIILTAPPADYIADHEMTSLLVRDACFAASCPNYATRQWEPAPSLEKIPHLYFVDPLEGTDRRGRPVPPDFYVDVSGVFPMKRDMLACHASQRNWLLRQHGIDEYLEMQARWGARRGAEVGVAQAEVFRQYRGHPYPQENLLLHLLGQDGRGKPITAAPE
ncbi:MAG: PIG-L deacetylase family protein [Isosphaeraceae bacterium]